MTKETTAINRSSSSSSHMPSVNQSLSSPPPPSTSTLQKLLGPLPRVGTNPSKVHCMSSDELNDDDGMCGDGTCTRNLKKTSTSIQPWFAKLFPTKSQDLVATHKKPCGKEPSVRVSEHRCNTRTPIPSLRRALSHRSSSSSSYFPAQQRRDSLELIYKQSENGVKYRPAIPHPLIEKVRGLEGMADTDEGCSLRVPSSLVAERSSRRGAQA